MVGALQGLRAGDERPPPGAAPRQRNDIVGRDAADRRRPGGVLWLSIIATQQIRREFLPTRAVPIEKGAVVHAFGHECVREAEHQRDIGAGPDRVPHRIDRVRQIVPDRPDQVKLDAAPPRRHKTIACDMLTGAAAADIAVLQRHAAKGEDERALRHHLRPADIIAGDRGLRPDDMRQDDRGRP